MGDVPGVTLAGRSYGFADLRTLLARASPRRSGDELAGIAAASQEERVAAQFCLADVELATFLDEPLIPWEIDDVTRLIHDQHDDDAFAPIRSMTVGELRDWLLSYDTTIDRSSRPWRGGSRPRWSPRSARSWGTRTSSSSPAKCSNVTAFRSTIGLPGRLVGPAPAQPSHRRPAGDHGLDRRRAAPRLRRRRDRHQPCARLTAAQPAAARHARRVDRPLRDPDAVVRARPRDDDAAVRSTTARRSTSCSSRSPAPRPPTARSGSRSTCSPRRTTRPRRCSAARSERT